MSGNIDQIRRLIATTDEEMSPDTLRVLRDMNDLSDEERMDVFMFFCRHCGSDNPGCQCWNDE